MQAINYYAFEYEKLEWFAKMFLPIFLLTTKGGILHFRVYGDLLFLLQ